MQPVSHGKSAPSHTASPPDAGEEEKLWYGNWRGDAASNRQVLASLATAQQLEQSALAAGRGGWRLLSHVYRAYFDATAREARAYEAIAVAAAATSPSVAQAEATLREPFTDPQAQRWRAKLRELAAAINASASLCGGCAAGGMAVLQSQIPDLSLGTIDTPLADQQFLLARLARIGASNATAARAELRDLLSWTAPAPGALYDQLGLSPRNARLDTGAGPEADPQYVCTPPCGECGAGDGDPQRLAWMRWAQVYGDAPLTLRYADLSSDAQYTTDTRDDQLAWTFWNIFG
ncbi:hypothetical protein EMIHUDRAFT_224864 [Emiliania huxleyi CCMP1516]|uniref:Uncharacterized protein n=2 Tax=Emiliania huxleyi TaxID=2903 RepID=A0A0D3KQ58_EMIH1|nr:hypothetical protein EMIHUDRAFT_224864 [Emiliania huxleyi CCMP1516]EOD37893.1 hypothetical protein EMIHUDRAFT_224864 [Emiliania huxleyi CCMP1516]|eukprot:XP_005790322.1 hypothetical protein EMIHUDRAFT_224864 [Emiliania huxleyi CCMP1516]